MRRQALSSASASFPPPQLSPPALNCRCVLIVNIPTSARPVHRPQRVCLNLIFRRSVTQITLACARGALESSPSETGRWYPSEEKHHVAQR